MYCDHCGKQVPDGDVCPECGAQLGEKTVGIWDGVPLVQEQHTTLPAQTPQKKGGGFGGAIGLFFKNYVNFSGRSGKEEFWWAFLFTLIVTAAVSALSAIFPFIAVLGLVIFLPGISLSVRRLHDIGKSGCWG